jgi:undecaprenyl-diphosphatase
MLDKILSLDTQLFRCINGDRSIFKDWFFSLFSAHITIGVVIIAIFLYVIIKKQFRFWWVYVLVIALCFLLADRISVVCFKDVFCRLRPSHALEGVITVKLKGLSSLIYDNRGGLYGFVSSHAANTFAIITSMILVLRREKTILFYILLVLWGILTGLSRVYCGYHYPLDVVCGALLGVILGAFVYFLYSKAIRWLEELSRKKKTNNPSAKHN